VIFEKKIILQNVAVISLAVLLLLAGLKGYGSGKLAAQSEVVIHNAQEITLGLDYFLPTRTGFLLLLNLLTRR
jgi:hypothetical protein